jgi:hypothetical protein
VDGPQIIAIWNKLVGFGYVKDGIRVRGNWFPILKMEWVDGANMDRWVENHLRDARALRKSPPAGMARHGPCSSSPTP